MKFNSQQQRIKNFLKNHKTITRIEAYESLGITELPKRISELRRLGEPIADAWVNVVNRFGEKTRVKAYFYIQGEKNE